MCLAIPMRLKKVDGPIGIVEMGGMEKEIRLELLDAPRINDYVLVHAGFAIEKIDEAEAKKTVELISRLRDKNE